MRKHPETGAKVDLLFKQISDGDLAAYTFLCVFDEYFEDVMKLLAFGNKDQGALVQMLARTNTLYSLPFYVRNGHLLHLTIQQAFDSLAHDYSPLCFAVVILAVANLKLGFEGARKLSPEIRQVAYASKLYNVPVKE